MRKKGTVINQVHERDISRIAVIGPGAIGGLVTAWLCQDPLHEVTVCARTPFDTLTLEVDGVSMEAKPGVLTQVGDASPVDWVLVATKAYDSSAAADWFPGLLGPHTRVAVLQNGVDHVERFSAFLPKERILPVMVDCPTERIAPGRIRQRGKATLVVPATEHGKVFTRLFTNTQIEAGVDSDFLTIAWRKLCVNAAGAVNALLLEPAGIAHNESAAYVMRRLIQEAVEVGRAEGAILGESIADEVIGIYQGHPGDSVNSLHADRLAGRPMEIDLRNGVIVRLGRKHGIETPFNEMAVALLTSISGS